MVLQSFGGSLGLLLEALGGSWGALGSSLGPPDRPKKAPRFVLGLSWVWFARFLLPKMALGGFWGRLWLVLGAPEGLFGDVLASDKPISTIKTALPSFDTLFSLAVVVEYIIILIIIIVVLLDFAQLQFCQTVYLESLLFSESAFLHSKMMTRHPVDVVVMSFFLCPGG